ncbi:hypothetical protein ACP70R_041666 [Stipagrostis hirtigluma subsp. patula]
MERKEAEMKALWARLDRSGSRGRRGGGGDSDSELTAAIPVGEHSEAIAGSSPVADSEEASRRESSESLYSNVQSSFSRGSELDGSGTDSPICSPPSCSTPPTVPSPEADADPRRRTKPEEEEEDAEKSVPLPSTPMSSVTVSITVQSPMDAVTRLKRFLNFGRRNGKAGEVSAAVVDGTSHSEAPPVGDGSISGGPAVGFVKAKLVRSLQNLVPSYPANAELNEDVPYAKSPRVHRIILLLFIVQI